MNGAAFGTGLNFLWKNKNVKVKRAGLYPDREKGGIRMTDVELNYD